MADLSCFWRDRATTYGHTGWGNQVVYAYDQLERLEIVSILLARAGVTPADGVAMDFGCGTGDFSRMLLSMGFEVYGHDPFVRPRLDDPRFTFIADPAALESLPPVDLVLSVTVLDHVLDEAELDATLSRVHRIMRPGGRLLLLEYALDDEDDAEPNAYQAFRTARAWHEILKRNAFDILDSGPVPHPIESPSSGFLSYRSSLAVRAFASLDLPRLKLPRAILRRLARRSLESSPPRIPHPQPSPMRFMVCES